ncbi:MAG: DeoR/GlpR transcriptional regulator, partial [Acidobacteria bacterium]|nr:DeoR/GlpR transcriptional regulator [Acidobacteriota bacterium]
INGIDPVFGPTINDEGEAAVNSMMARRAVDAYMVADSSKIGQRAFATLDGYEFSKLITDSGISAESVADFKTHGIDVLVADDGA